MKQEEELRMQKRYNEEKLIEEMKSQPVCKKLEQETKDTDQTEDDKLNRKDFATNAKLPELVITKFKGTHLD